MVEALEDDACRFDLEDGDSLCAVLSPVDKALAEDSMVLMTKLFKFTSSSACAAMLSSRGTLMRLIRALYL